MTADSVRFACVEQDDVVGWCWCRGTQFGSGATRHAALAPLLASVDALSPFLGRSQFHGPTVFECALPTASSANLWEQALLDGVRHALTRRWVQFADTRTPTDERCEERAARAARYFPRCQEVWVAVDGGFRDGVGRWGWVAGDGRQGSGVVASRSSMTVEQEALSAAVESCGDGAILRVLCDQDSVIRQARNRQRSRKMPAAGDGPSTRLEEAVFGRRWDQFLWVPGGSGAHAQAHLLTQPSWT